MKLKMKKLASGMMIVTFFAGGTAFADESMMSMMSSMQTAMQEMQKTIQAQGSEIARLNAREPQIVKAESAGEVAAVPAMSKGEFKEKLKGELGDYKWFKGFKHSGDFRLRYEAQNEQHNSALNDRNRFRFRLRYQVEKDLYDDFKVGFRLASGPTTSPAVGSENLGGITSTNQTFDNNFDMKAISIDKAWATYTPEWAKVGPIKRLEITGGKWKNPFEEGSSLMIWDRDVTPEGLYEKLVVKGLKTEHLDTDITATAGQMILEEGSGSLHDDAELWAFQGGFKHKIQLDGVESPVEVKNLVSYYNFSDFTRTGNFQASNGNFTCSGGTTLCAGDFDILEIYNEIGFSLFGLPKTVVFSDLAWNVKEMTPSAGTNLGAGQNGSYGMGAKIGKAKKKGTWQAGYEYYNIEANSVPGVFSDSDFGHADRRGSVIRFGYALTDNLVLNSSMFFTNRLSTDSIAGRGDNERKLFQVDLVWKV